VAVYKAMNTRSIRTFVLAPVNPLIAVKTAESSFACNRSVFTLPDCLFSTKQYQAKVRTIDARPKSVVVESLITLNPFYEYNQMVYCQRKVNENVAPFPGPSLSALTLPPCRSTMRFTFARPIPVPGKSGSRCSLSNGRKSLST